MKLLGIILWCIGLLVNIFSSNVMFTTKGFISISNQILGNRYLQLRIQDTFIWLSEDSRFKEHFKSLLVLQLVGSKAITFFLLVQLHSTKHNYLLENKTAKCAQ